MAANGTLEWGKRYTTWGALALKPQPEAELQADDPSDLNPWRLPGQYADPESGLYYNRHRHYDPLTGHYASPDPIGLAGGDRPQGYVERPTCWTDPLGLGPRPALPPPRGDSPYMPGAPITSFIVPKDGLEVNMALDRTQPSNRPGGFSTEEAIPDLAFVRQQLAVKSDWKSDDLVVQRYRIAPGTRVQRSTVGPQVEVDGTVLPGGATQIEILRPPGTRPGDFMTPIGPRIPIR